MKKKTVFIFPIPSMGHLAPLLPIMSQLQKKGYLVRVYTSSEYASLIEETGAALVKDDTSHEFFDLVGTPKDVSRYGFPDLSKLVARMDELLREEIRLYVPEGVIIDSYAYSVRLAIQKYSVPVVLSCAGMIMNRDIMEYYYKYTDSLFRQITTFQPDWMKKLEKKGYQIKDILSLYEIKEDDDCVTYISDEIQPYADRMNREHTFFAGYAAYADRGSYEKKPGTRPLIYITMGTSGRETASFFQNCVAAFRDRDDLEIFMAVFDESIIEELGELPEHMKAAAFVNQKEVLDKAAALIFHGGMNTFQDGLLAGVPMAIYPLRFDQSANARRLEELGAGVALDNCSPLTLQRVVRLLLTIPDYRQRAGELGDHMRSLGGAPAAVEWILSRFREQKKERNSGRKGFLDTARYTAANLTQQDLSWIISMYGNSVQDIYELAPGQQWMLEAGSQVSSAFFLQILTKAVISLDPAAFRQQADRVCEKHENLRSAFAYRNMQNPYRVVLKDRHPEINYFDLSDLDMEAFDKRIAKLMEADRRRGFDLEKDSLLRISVYKSCEKDTYALIVSQPHINSDGMSLGLLFGDLFVGYVLDLNGIDKKIEEQSYQAYAEHLQNADIDKELSFWKEYLGDLDGDVLLPGQHPSDLEYKSAEYFEPFSDEELSTLKEMQKKLKVTQFTLLQTLWGIMVARLKNKNKMVFGAVTSGRDAQVSDSMKLGGGFVNVLPVKIEFSEDEKYTDLAKRVQRDFVGCLENSHCSPGQIQKALGGEKPVFGHILNNHNFVKSKQSLSSGGGIPGIRILGGDTYDNLSADLCLYFTEKEGQAGCIYSYNQRAFSGEVIQLLGEYFMKMLSALAHVTPETTIRDFPVFDSALLLAAQDNEQIRQEKIASIMKRNPLFGGVEDNELYFLANECFTTSFAEDEIILRIGEQQSRIPILVSGKAIIYGETRKGWNNPVRIPGQGRVLSYSALLDSKEENIIVSGEDGTVVLFVPADVLHILLENHTEISMRIIKDLKSQNESYMKLWLNAE